MLTMMRNMLRSKAAGLLFVILIVAMAAWGMTDMFGGGLGSNLAGAGKRTLSSSSFDATVERILRNQSDDQGRSLTKGQALEQGLIDRVFQQEQFDLALRAYADKIGATATQAAVKEAISTNEVFHDTTGLFDPQRYAAILESNGFRPAGFEDSIEAGLTVERLQGMPIAALRVPKALARLRGAYTGEMRSASWITVSQANLPPIEEPTEEAVRTLYDTRQDAIREPERRAVSLLRLSPEDFTNPTTIADDDVRAFYEAYKLDRFSTPGTRTFIEFQFPDEATGRAALGRIAGGASPDAIQGLTGSSTRSGGRDIISNETLAAQIFDPSAQINSLFGPRQLDGNWAVLKLTDITPGETSPFEMVEDIIRTDLAREQAVTAFYQALPLLDDLIGTGAGLEEIAQEIGAPVLSFAPVDVAGRAKSGARFTPLLETSQLLQEVFNRPQGAVTPRLGDGEVVYMARIDSIIEERMPDFEEVREALTFAAKQQAENEQLQRVGAEIETRLNSGETTLADEAIRYQTRVDTMPRPLTRQNFRANLPPSLINGLFEARREGEVQSAPGLPGSTIVMQVDVIDRPAPETLDLLADAMGVDVQGQLAEDLFQAYFLEIQSEIDLEINAGAFEAYKRTIDTAQQ